jgi:hypothetical protein
LLALQEPQRQQQQTQVQQQHQTPLLLPLRQLLHPAPSDLLPTAAAHCQDQMRSAVLTPAYGQPPQPLLLLWLQGQQHLHRTAPTPAAAAAAEGAVAEEAQTEQSAAMQVQEQQDAAVRPTVCRFPSWP